MLDRAWVVLCNTLVSIMFLAGLALLLAATGAAGAGLNESYGKLPLHFEENRGQVDAEVRFLARGPGYGLYLTSSDAVLALDGAVLRMALVGANPESPVKGLDELPGKTNYFIGKDRSKWRTGVPTYAKVRYREVYPGIDLVYYGNQRQLEYDFVVAPGADPKQIALRFEGARKLEIEATSGDLVLHVAQGDMRVKKPVVYQDIDGVRRIIEGRYAIDDEHRVSFELAAYDTTKPLVIDPILAYSTYLGGSAPALHARGNDLALAIAADRFGNAYVTGRTATFDFPTTPGSVQPAAATPTDAFVAKLNPSGTALVYSTYLGGGGADIGRGIAVDAQGNAYLTGHTTSADFPTTSGVLNVIGGSGFAAKLDAAGASLVYSTYLPAGGDGLALDAGGNAYITGQTDSSGFPTTPGAVQPVFGGGTDAFVLKLDPTGTLPLYATLLGGSGSEAGFGIAVDADGSAYVTGYTDSVDFRTTPGAVQPVIHGPSDAFVTKLDATGTVLAYSTYLGGHEYDVARAIALDSARSAHVTGGTTSSDFPTTPGAFQEAFPGAYGPAFVAKLSADGSALAYATYLGGSADWGGGINATGAGIAVCAAGHAYVTGYTFTPDFPATPDAAQPAFGGGWDAFVTVLNAAGSSPVYSTFLGGNLGDEGSAIAVDAAGSVYVAGGTSSANFPTTPGAVQPVYAGGGADSQYNSDGDAFVVKFQGDAAAEATATRHEEDAASYQGYWPTYGAETGTFSGGTIRATNQATATATFSFTGTAVTWIGVKCNVCGLASVHIDGGAPTVVDTFGPGEPGSLTSEPVFTASGLAPGVTHTLMIIVTGGGTGLPGSLTGSAHVAVDAFDVTQ